MTNIKEHDAATTARPALSPLRNRKGPAAMSTRNSSNSPAPNQLPRRRSSMISLGTESVSSLRSTTDDLLLPRVSNSGLHDEPSALHSAPLFLAIVPAVAGLVFKNGSAIMTDVTLLACAAVLLNWSIRLPWDWYHSAQAVRTPDSLNVEDYLPVDGQDTIAEETEEGTDETQGGAESKDAAPRSTTATDEQISAASKLRLHEIFALVACFLGPLMGAWLLHTIRASLSRPSEGLVSNYNLTIFLLASEIRPLSHLVKLIQNQTLHLQRVVAQNPHLSGSTSGSSVISTDEITALASRVSALEGDSAETNGNGHKIPILPTAAARETLILDVRRSLQPDIDALNRAVRRYEKRAMLLSMQIDGRLNTLETRMQDTLALAAAAERNVSGSRKGSAGVLLDYLAGLIVLPLQAGAWLINTVLELPARLVHFLGRALKEIAVIVLPEALIRRFQGKQLDAKPRVRRDKAKVVKKAG